eukprot:45998_1
MAVTDFKYKESSYLKLFDEIPDEVENNIFIGEIWDSSEYTQIEQPEPGAIDTSNKTQATTNEILEGKEESKEKDDDFELYSIPDNKELKLMYKKVLCWTFIALTFCVIALLAAIISKFYTWRGITFNSIVIVACIIGIYCGIFIDNKSTKHAINKLKVLLIYWIIVCIFVIIILVILIVYAFIMPIRYWNNIEYSTFTVVTSTIFYVLGVIFWIFFVSFYIDLVSRACLKRGRIDYIILIVTAKNEQDNKINDKNGWLKIYKCVIWYRIQWRKCRNVFTTCTGIRCLFDKNKTIKNKEHEEQRVIDMLEEGQTNINKKNFKLKCKFGLCDQCTNCLYCFCYPFILCYKGMIQIGIGCIKGCGGCIVTICDCSRFATGSLVCCQACCGLICIAVLCWIFFPIFVWFIIAVLIAGYCLVAVSAATSVHSNKEDLGYLAFVCACLCALPIWYIIWYGYICPKPYDLSTDDWTWDEQCNMWHIVNVILAVIAEAFSN